MLELFKVSNQMEMTTTRMVSIKMFSFALYFITISPDAPVASELFDNTGTELAMSRKMTGDSQPTSMSLPTSIQLNSI